MIRISGGLSQIGQLFSRLSPVISTPSASAGRWFDQPFRSFSGKSDAVLTVNNSSRQLRLSRMNAAPVFAPISPSGKVFGLVVGKGGEMITNYALFEAAIKKSEISWTQYDYLTSTERTVHMAHIRAVQERKTTYRDPFTGYSVFTVSQLILNEKCCGNGCRHCPYGLENASEKTKKSKNWNGAYWV